MKKIKLTKGNYALVDDDDYDWLNQWNWQVKKGAHTLYAFRTAGGRKNKHDIAMHRIILGITDKAVDGEHKDGNGLNNQRYNLRVASRSQNCANRRVFKNSKSGFKGVYFLKKTNRWRAHIQINGTRILIGDYKIKEDAAIAYNKAAVKYFGEFAFLNKV